MASDKLVQARMVAAISPAAGTSRSGNGRELSRIMTGPRPWPLGMGAACLLRSRYNDNEEGVQPNLDALLARSALPFSQGAESYDGEHIILHSLCNNMQWPADCHFDVAVDTVLS